MKVKYLFNDQIYVISNHAVAANPIFRNEQLCERFLKKLELYLSELCTIYHYVFHDNQFQILMRLASREDFCAYYRKKKGELDLMETEIPHSSYIFSQAMANLQASMAIHINRTQSRTGALFARRFSKVLITSRRSFNNWFEHFERLKKFHKYEKQWDNKYKDEQRAESSLRVEELIHWCACWFYRYLESRHPVLSSFKRYQDFDLEGQICNSLLIKIPANQRRKIVLKIQDFNPNSG